MNSASKYGGTKRSAELAAGKDNNSNKKRRLPAEAPDGHPCPTADDDDEILIFPDHLDYLKISAVSFYEIINRWQDLNAIDADGYRTEISYDGFRSHHAPDVDVFARLVQHSAFFLRSLPTKSWKPLQPFGARRAAVALVAVGLPPSGLAELVLDYVAEWTPYPPGTLLVWQQEESDERTDAHGNHEPPTRISMDRAPGGVDLCLAYSAKISTYFLNAAHNPHCKPLEDVVSVLDDGKGGRRIVGYEPPETFCGNPSMEDNNQAVVQNKEYNAWERYYCRDFGRDPDGGNRYLRVAEHQANVLLVPDMRSEFIRFLATGLAATNFTKKVRSSAFLKLLNLEKERLETMSQLSLSDLAIHVHSLLSIKKRANR